MNKYKNSNNLKKEKRKFKLRIKKYHIGTDKKLRKLVEIKDKHSNISIVHDLIMVSHNEIDNMLKYYHYITEHKNYHILFNKIILEGFYTKALIDRCKDYIKNCSNCVSKNKTKFLSLPTNQILFEKPKELYVIGLTLIPKELTNNNDNFVYLFSLIDNFSKFAGNYIIKN